MYLNKTGNSRGFQSIDFNDLCDKPCVISQSSNMKQQIWLGCTSLSYDEDNNPYNTKICLDRKSSFKIAMRLIIFSLTGQLFKKKK